MEFAKVNFVDKENYFCNNFAVHLTLHENTKRGFKWQ